MRRCVGAGLAPPKPSAHALARSFLLLAIACLLLLVLPGCRREAHTGRGPVHLTLWSMWTGQEEKNFRQVLALYQKTHPGVVIDDLGAVTDDTKTLRAIVAGVPPDVFTLADPLYLGPLAANGAILPLDDRFKASGLREGDFVPASLRQCRYKGRLYAMPYLIDDLALMWNKRAFRDAGLDPDRPPQTLEELADYAERLTRRKNGTIERLGMEPLGDNYALNLFFGGGLYDEAHNRVTPDAPGNIAAMQWYVGLMNRMGGYQEVNAFAAGFGAAQGANNPFFVGKVAMMAAGEWNPSWCMRYAPGLEYGVAPIPPLRERPDRARSTWLGGNMICIPKESKHPKEAWDLLVWMQSEEAQVLFASLMNNVPNQRAALHSPVLRTGAPYKEKFATFLDLADSPNAGSFPALPVANLYNSAMTTARDQVLDGDKTPAQALRDVRVRVQRELDKYR